MPISLFVGIPLVAVCYLLVNVAFFIVLSYDEILSAKAVALVSWSNHGYCTKTVLCRVYFMRVGQGVLCPPPLSNWLSLALIWGPSP